MTRAVLNRLHHPRQISQAIDAFIEVYHAEAAPLEWRKESVHQVPLKQHYAYLLAATRFTP